MGTQKKRKIRRKKSEEMRSSPVSVAPPAAFRSHQKMERNLSSVQLRTYLTHGGYVRPVERKRKSERRGGVGWGGPVGEPLIVPARLSSGHGGLPPLGVTVELSGAAWRAGWPSSNCHMNEMNQTCSCIRANGSHRACIFIGPITHLNAGMHQFSDPKKSQHELRMANLWPATAI